MARMTCRCGADLSNQEAPNDIELVVYTDKEWAMMVGVRYVSAYMFMKTERTPQPWFIG